MDPASAAQAASPQAAHTPGHGDLREHLGFRLGEERCAIDGLRVQEIRGFERPTRLAEAPPSVLGVLNLRGAAAFGTETDTACATGIGRARRGDHDALHIVVDIERLMSADDIGLAAASRRH